MITDCDVLVLGGSVAGGSLVAQLRVDGYAGRVIVVDQDRDAPYDRPPLSKDFLTAVGPRPEARWWDDRCELVRGSVYRLDIASRAADIELPDGSTARVSGEHVVIATGSAPVRLPGEPNGVAHLRTARDARALREYAHPDRHVLILGAGTIGTELASSIVGAGGQATLIDMASQPLQRFLGGHLGAEAAAWIRGAGVSLRLDTRVQLIEHRKDHWQVITDRSEHRGDLVVSAVGTRPAVDWLDGSGLNLLDGVRCDYYGAALGKDGAVVEGIHAVGDVAAWQNRRGAHRRFEDWTTAQRHGRAVANRISGARIRKEVDELPYLWTQQFGRRLQVLGTPVPEAELHTQVQDPGRRAAFYTLHRDGNPIAWISINRPREFAQAMREVAVTSV